MGVVHFRGETPYPNKKIAFGRITMERCRSSSPGVVFLLSVHLVGPCTLLLGQADLSASEAALAARGESRG